MKAYILSIDQSTQGTKAMLLDETGQLLVKVDKAHRQYIDQNGWVEHDPVEIRENIDALAREAIEKTGISPADVCAIALTNQRETVMMWDGETGRTLHRAIVWQCSRAQGIADELQKQGKGEMCREKTGLRLSPYFSAAKLTWLMRNVPAARVCAAKGTLRCGTMDAWMVYCLTDGKVFKTDVSNASRTQLMNIRTLKWDAEICGCFGIPLSSLPEITDSDGMYGETDFHGLLPRKVPIRCVMGDSHGSLFGLGCVEKGMLKTSYGTGSSIMMNIGSEPVLSSHGLVTSVAWKLRGQLNYVLEGNVNYSASIITWLKDGLHMISDPGETDALARTACPEDHTYLVPAFTGMGAPYWRNDLKAAFIGMSRTTMRAELVRAALECIAYQNTDIITCMRQDTGQEQVEIRADGGASKNAWLMQFQSDIQNARVLTADTAELSGLGAAYAAGIATGLYSADVLNRIAFRSYTPEMSNEKREEKLNGWKNALELVMR